MLIINNSKSSGPVLSLRDINSSDLMLRFINNSKSNGSLLPLQDISSLDVKGCGLSITQSLADQCYHFEISIVQTECCG